MDQTVRLWDANDGAEIAVLRGHQGGVRACVFSPDSSTIVSAGGRHDLDDPKKSFGELKIWSVATGEELASLNGHADQVTCCAFLADGESIISASADGVLKAWNVATGREQPTELGSKPVGIFTLSPDGTRIVSAYGFDGVLRLADARTGEELADLTGHVYEVNACAFSRDGKQIASGSYACRASDLFQIEVLEELKLWDGQTGRELVANLSTATGTVHACAFSSDASRIVSGSDDQTVKLWDASTGKHLATLQGHSGTVKACAFSPDGTRIISGSSDHALKVWDAVLAQSPQAARSDEASSTLARWVGSASVFALSGDGSWAVCGGYGAFRSAVITAVAVLWDTERGEKPDLLHGQSSMSSLCEFSACAFSPNGTRLLTATAAESHTLTVWNLDTKDAVLTLAGETSPVQACAFSPDGQRIISASYDGTLKLWDAASGTMLATLAAHGLPVSGCLFVPDGSRVVSYSRDGTSRLWDVETGRQLVVFAGNSDSVVGCAVSPDGRRLVSAFHDGTLKLWELETGREIATLSAHTGQVSACAFSPDGKLIASASEDGTLMLWDGAIGTASGKLTGHTDSVTTCAFAPDGTRLASASADGTVRVWAVDAATEMCRYCLSERIIGIGWHPDGGRLVVATERARVCLLQEENDRPASPVVTAWQPPRSFFQRQHTIHVGCPLCRAWFETPSSAAGGEVDCRVCSSSLKVNPFTIRADWRPMAKAWRGPAVKC
ncbi:MAG: WD40 repeat domain-containing protein [Acidobacteriota bacterium]|nr:WD40 repeat domain-containing protein [Acidobacteriota bacterium]